MNITRGDIYYANLMPVIGSEQGGIRPVLVIQNNVGNRHSPTVIVAAITSQTGKTWLPTHVQLDGMKGLCRDSIILLEQVRTIDRARLGDYIGRLSVSTMQSVNQAIAVSFGLEPILYKDRIPAAIKKDHMGKERQAPCNRVSHVLF